MSFKIEKFNIRSSTHQEQYLYKTDLFTIMITKDLYPGSLDKTYSLYFIDNKSNSPLNYALDKEQIVGLMTYINECLDNE